MFFYFALVGSLSAQSFWFPGLLRNPGDNFLAELSFHGHDLNAVELRIPSEGAVLAPSGENTVIGFQSIALGAEAAMRWKYFELEGGADLAFGSIEIDSIDDPVFGLNLKIGGIIKYNFEFSDNMELIPYFRSGFSMEYMMGEFLFVDEFGRYVYIGSDDYYTTFYNAAFGGLYKWGKFQTGLQFGKYIPIAGSLSDMGDILEPISPLYLQLRLGYAGFSLGYRKDFYNDTATFYDQDGENQVDLEWKGGVLDVAWSVDW